MARHQTHACRNCGAPLAIPDDHDRFFRCEHCGSVLEDVTPPAARQSGRIEISVPLQQVDIDDLQSYATPVRAVGMIIMLITVLSIGAAAVVGFAVLNDGTGSITDALTGGGGPEIYNYAAAAAVDADDGGERDVVAVARTPEDPRIVYFDPDGASPTRWSVQRALDSDTFTRFVTTDELVVVSAERNLVALERATGAERWSATLSDVVQPNICTDCVARFGDLIVTLTADGVLAGRSLASGEPQWSVTLVGTPRQIVNLGGNPAVLDTVDDDAALAVFSAVTGEALEVLPLGCTDRTFGGHNAVGIYDVLFPVPDGTVVYVADPSFGGCAQRWAAGSDSPLWDVPYEYPSPTGATAEHVQVSDAAIVIADRTAVDVLDLASGTPRRLAELADTELSVIGAGDGVVAVAAKSTRGTPSWSIRALDLASGNERWTFDVEAPDRIEETRSFSIGDSWTAAVTSAGLTVAQYRSEELEMVLQTVPLAEGNRSPPTVIDLSGRGITDSLTIFGWSGDDLLAAMVNSFLVIDGPSGRIAAEMP